MHQSMVGSCSKINRIYYKLSQYYEWALIAAAIVFMLASFLVNRGAKREGDAKLVK